VPAPGPYAWDFHLPAWVALAVGVGLVIFGHRRLERRADPPIPWTSRQMTLFAVACGAAVVALTWPVADLAAHWSLIALVTQRLILLMAVAPMLLLGLPYDLIQWVTRPAAVDTILVRLQRPPVAIATVTIIVIGSMTPLMVRAQASSFIARGAIDLAIVAAGLVLWIPVLGRIPGLPRAKPVVRFGYLVAQAVIPAFLSFVYIFSRRPLYPEFARSHAAVDLRPLNDQQIAGFVSKLTMLFVLLIVGAVVLSRAPRSDEEFGSDELVWADVERQFERVDRQGTREVAVEPEVGVGVGPAPEPAPPEDSVPEHKLSEPGQPEPPENEPPEH
jgi:cytochrome c oxidase assembly factor CtaG